MKGLVVRLLLWLCGGVLLLWLVLGWYVVARVAADRRELLAQASADGADRLVALLAELPEDRWEAALPELAESTGVLASLDLPLPPPGASRGPPWAALFGERPPGRGPPPMLRENGGPPRGRAGAHRVQLPNGRTLHVRAAHLGPPEAGWLPSAVPLLLIVLVGVVTWFAVGRPLTRGAAALADAISRFGAEDLGVRAPEGRDTPLADLGRRFNRTAAHLERLVTTQRQVFQAVSHELRTPAARIRFRTESLRNGADPTNTAAGIDADLDEIDRLVDEIVGFLRYDAADHAPHPEAWDVADLLRTRITQLGAAGGPCELRFEGPSSLVCRPTPSQRWLLRAVDNLAQNARRHGKVQATVRLAEGSEGLRVTVDDDGPGIPEDQRARVREPFVTGTSDGNKGLGLGLAIVQRIVDRTGGHFEIAEAPSGGARCVLTFPMAGVA